MGVLNVQRCNKNKNFLLKANATIIRGGVRGEH